jgi:hypothetical protein
MDWLEIAKTAGPYVVMGIAALWGYFVYKSKRADAREAANLLTTTEWLAREKARDEEIAAIRAQMDSLRETYDKRLEAKNTEVKTLQEENVQLKVEVAELRHKVKNLESIKKLEAEI